MPPYSPFYIYIRCLYCRGIISGYADNTFRPYSNVTRGQAAKMISNSAGFNEAVSEQTFADVPPSSPFYVYIERLARRGMINGYDDGTFRPLRPVTRGQLAKIDANAAGYTDIPPAGTKSFADVSPNDPFYTYIERLARRGIVSGYECGSGAVNACTGAVETCDRAGRPYFRACVNITRAQTSKIDANTFFPNACAPGPARK